MAHVKLEVSQHPWRCIDEDGKRCPHILVSHFGMRWHCRLFSGMDKVPFDALPERDGCLAKLQECMDLTEAD